MAKEQPNKAKPAGKNSQEPKKPKFSPYWIYAGIILIFLGIQFFAGGGFNEPSKTNPAEFETYLENGDVKRVVIVNRKMAQVFLTDEAKAKDTHKKTEDSKFLPAAGTPDYTFEFGDLQNFENMISDAKKNNSISTVVTYKTESNVWGDMTNNDPPWEPRRLPQTT